MRDLPEAAEDAVQLLLDDEKTRTGDSFIRHTVCICERSLGCGHRSDGQPVHLMCLIGEQSLCSNCVVLLRDNVERLHDRPILLVDVGEPQRVSINFVLILDGKGNLDASGLCGRGYNDIERRKGFKWDGVNVGASSGHDEALNGSEGKVEIASRQEWQFTRDLALHDAEPSLLLSLLANNRGNLACQRKVTTESESLHDVLQSTQNYICEGGGENKGGIEVLHWEGILARLDWVNANMGQGVVGVQGMEFLLLHPISKYHRVAREHHVIQPESPASRSKQNHNPLHQ